MRQSQYANMRIRFPAPPLAAFLLLTGLAGCAPMLLATAGAVAGYAVSKDSVTLDMDRSWNQVWAACLEEVRYLGGRIKKEDGKDGRLDAQIKKTDVVVTLEQLTHSTVRVVIRARRNLLPQVEIAQRLGVGIAQRAR